MHLFKVKRALSIWVALLKWLLVPSKAQRTRQMQHPKKEFNLKARNIKRTSLITANILRAIYHYRFSLSFKIKLRTATSQSSLNQTPRRINSLCPNSIREQAIFLPYQPITSPINSAILLYLFLILLIEVTRGRPYNLIKAPAKPISRTPS